MSGRGAEEAWPSLLRELLEASPIVDNLALDPEPHRQDRGCDGVADFTIAGESHRLIIECKSSGQPRYVRDAMGQLVHFSVSGPHRSGNRRSARKPPPARLLKVMCPPCRTVKSCTMYKPSPVPPVPRLREVSTR